VIVSAVATLNGHPFCTSQLHILFRLKLLILREHTATLDTRWCTVIQWKMNDTHVQGCVAPCLIISLQSSWTSQRLSSFELWCHAVCSCYQSRRPQFKFSSPYKPYKYDQAHLTFRGPCSVIYSYNKTN